MLNDRTRARLRQTINRRVDALAEARRLAPLLGPDGRPDVKVVTMTTLRRLSRALRLVALGVLAILAMLLVAAALGDDAVAAALTFLPDGPCCRRREPRVPQRDPR